MPAYVHDESHMRVRSYDASMGSKLCRGRYSKILNHAVSVYSQGTSMEYFTELQALASKNGPSIATALIRVTMDILEHVVEKQITEAKCNHDFSSFRISEQGTNIVP
jgi:Holliday junction resolvasome RuvABC ATP-dependent DNA helicase subunit